MTSATSTTAGSTASRDGGRENGDDQRAVRPRDELTALADMAREPGAHPVIDLHGEHTEVGRSDERLQSDGYRHHRDLMFADRL